MESSYFFGELDVSSMAIDLSVTMHLWGKSGERETLRVILHNSKLKSQNEFAEYWWEIRVKENLREKLCEKVS